MTDTVTDVTTAATDTGDATTEHAAATSSADNAKQVPDTPTATKDWAAEAEKWKSLARKHETAAKLNADAAKKYADIEEAQKTEQQKLTDKLTAAEAELAEHRAREIRVDAVRAAGLDIDMAQFLTESEPDKALEQAKVLAKRIAPPKADLKQGARTNKAPTEDMNSWLRRAAGYSTTP